MNSIQKTKVLNITMLLLCCTITVNLVSCKDSVMGSNESKDGNVVIKKDDAGFLR